MLEVVFSLLEFYVQNSSEENTTSEILINKK